MKVEFYRHSLDEKDAANVADVLRSTFLTTGPVTVQFEEAFNKYAGIENVVAVNSCTAALHLSLLGLDIGPGDEVITTPMTFIATATAILHAGARPVFVDVESDTGLLDVLNVEKAITERTKAILPVHLYGTMVDMRGLRDLADRFHLKIIEDCAHCIEGERDGVRPGQLGDTACYSFYATKNLTCGEGGALATNNHELAERIKLLRLHGMSKDAASRYGGNYQHWDMLELGWKYNMSDIQAALLVNQIERLDSLWQRRHEIAQKYDEAFQGSGSIQIPKLKGKSAHHLYTVWIDSDKRDRLLSELSTNGVGVTVNYRAVHTLKYFSEALPCSDNYANAERIGQSTISIPLYPNLADDEVDYVIETVKRLVGN
jgi:dTDP-4-amino-4,6-dideoxygalactose transaminase